MGIFDNLPNTKTHKNLNLLKEDFCLPLVSIVISTYNGEKYLAEQIESIVNQTYSNVEIIIIDDASIDSTSDIILFYQSKYPQIKVYFNDENIGYVKNFEKGGSLSKGDFISFCDQDDVWDLRKTEILMNEIGDYPLIFCDDLMVDENLQSLGKRQSDLVNSKSVNNPLYFVLDNVVGGHALILTRSLFDLARPFPQLIPHDLWCAFIASSHGGVKYLDRVLVQWRQHSFGVTKIKKDKDQRILETKKRLDIFYENFPVNQNQNKKVVENLIKAYSDFSFSNNILRTTVFFKYQKYLLGFKRRSNVRKFLYCLKMFYTLRLHVA